MSVAAECHKRVNEFGVGKCSVPMWSGYGMPAGFCDKDAYGEPVFSIGHWEDGRFIAKYVPFLACPNHGGPKTRVYLDGDMWCAVHPDFVNLQESDAGFGDTPTAARMALEAVPTEATS